jgi:hypothetical protein
MRQNAILNQWFVVINMDPLARVSGSWQDADRYECAITSSASRDAQPRERHPFFFAAAGGSAPRSWIP